MPDPRLPGRTGLYLSMLEYAAGHSRDFAREHWVFYERLRARFPGLGDWRVLDLGCGKTFWLTLLLHTHGVRVSGTDTEFVMPGRGIAKYREILRRNGIERLLRTAAWDLLFARAYYREFERLAGRPLRFDGIDVRSNVGATIPFADSSFDLVVSHEVLEHVADIPALAAELRRVLKPGGTTYLYVHNYTSLSGGHHIAWKFPDSRPSRVVPPWDHIRARRFRDVPSYLNEMREADYRIAFEQHFEIIDWIPGETEGERLLTPEVQAELAGFEVRELLLKGFTIVATPRKDH